MMFLNAMYFLNLIHLSRVAALIRFIMFHILPVEYKAYDTEVAGYTGWYENRWLGALAFEHPERPSLQFHW